MNALANDQVYRDRIATEFNSVTAENVMKWDTIEPQRGVLNFGPADELVAFAQSNRQKVRGHTLLWHNQLPGWLTAGVADGTIGPTELRSILRQHILDVVRHFRGKVYQWDVVNEVIDDNAQLRNTIWLQQLGSGYIADAFRWAHEADPAVKLYLNDYNVEGISAKSDAYYELAKQLLADHVPVDGMGIQGHLGVQFGFWPASTVAANMKRFEALGLETSVTEADVRMVMPADTVKLQAQAQGYSTLMQGCLLAKRCTSFTVWGYTDKYSWVPGFFTGQGAANLLDENFAPKPAYDEMQAVLRLGKE
jgi:endo-1,4-beta-xylanase